MKMMVKALIGCAAVLVLCSQAQLHAGCDRECEKRECVIVRDLLVTNNASFQRNVRIENLEILRELIVLGFTKTCNLEVRHDLRVQENTFLNNVFVEGELEFVKRLLQPVTVSPGHLVEFGDVLVVSPDADREVVASFQAAQETVLGVAASGNEMMNPRVRMVVGGEFLVKVIGPVHRGDFLETSTTQGTAMVSHGPSAFAIATSSDPSAGIKLVHARFIVADTF